jgi:hypothetical protein
MAYRLGSNREYGIDKKLLPAVQNDRFALVHAAPHLLDYISNEPLLLEEDVKIDRDVGGPDLVVVAKRVWVSLFGHLEKRI